MIHISKLSSGMLKACHSSVINVIANRTPITVGDETNSKTYKPVSSIRSNQLEKGMVVMAYYNQHNQGCDIYEFQGVTGDETKYGENPTRIFDSVKECYKHFEVRGGKALEELQDQNEYGRNSYLVVKDLNDGDSGSWFYLYEGRWSRGSGAEPLSWVLMEEVK